LVALLLRLQHPQQVSPSVPRLPRHPPASLSVAQPLPPHPRRQASLSAVNPLNPHKPLPLLASPSAREALAPRRLRRPRPRASPSAASKPSRDRATSSRSRPSPRRSHCDWT
jgi:hypothetical protein